VIAPLSIEHFTFPPPLLIRHFGGNSAASLVIEIYHFEENCGSTASLTGASLAAGSRSVFPLLFRAQPFNQKMPFAILEGSAPNQKRFYVHCW
jgi:hypothetical protein